MTEKKEIYERKMKYAQNKMRANSKIETLTDEQHEVLAKLCHIRHKLHCSHDKIWIGDFEALEPLNNINGPSRIDELLKEAHLPALNLGVDLSTLPQENDYYELLDEEEKEEWEKKAEAFNTENPGAFFHYSGCSLWQAESGVYNEFIDEMNMINDNIEKYLSSIDEKHGTKYCPSGYSRLYS